MTRRAIGVTSTSCMDFYSKPHSIRVLPMHVYIQGTEFLDSKELSSRHFLRYLQENPDPDISTSPPKLEKILAFLNTLINEGYDELIMITLSREISQAYEFIEQVATSYAPEIKVTLFDTMRTGFSEGMFALAAARLLDDGVPTCEIIQYLKAMRSRNSLFFCVDEPKGLSEKLLTASAAKVKKSIFQLKPILYLNTEGKIDLMSRTISLDKAIESICSLTRDFIGDQTYVLFAQTSEVEEIDALLFEKIHKYFGDVDVITFPMAPSLIAHMGVGSCALGVFL